MKIIQVDNFNSDDVGDRLVAENVIPHWGVHIVANLNAKFSSDVSSMFFMLVDDSHKLKEDFVP